MTAVVSAMSTADVLAAPSESSWRSRLATLWWWVREFALIALVGLVVPLGILLVGIPVALVVRAIIEIIAWL